MMSKLNLPGNGHKSVKTALKSLMSLSSTISPAELISVRRTLEETTPEDFIWVYWENDRWIPFADSVSATIETAFRNGFEETFIHEDYRIDFKYFIQEHLSDRKRRQVIRRWRHIPTPSFRDELMDEDESRRYERFSFPLGLVSCCSAGMDTDYYGSPFIAKWYLTFTNGRRDVTFDSIFSALVQGIREEGKTEKEHILNGIVCNLNKMKNEVHQKSEKIKMEALEDYCAKLYTKPCFIYRVVNIALRDNDFNKLHTLGPYCFLVFNYIGRYMDDERSIRFRLLKAFRPVRSKQITVYRGDYISPEMMEKYQQDVEDKSRYFKWLSFVSTSRDRDVAEKFAQNVLYIINMQDYSLRDQFADVSTISSCQQENEILLQPGVRFQVTKLEIDKMKLPIVHVNIVPSYVSTLR